MASQSFNRMDTARRRQFITSSSSSTSGRSGISFWLPLVLTVGVATAGVAAWIWNERQDDETFTSSEDYTDEESRTEARTADTVTVDNSRPIRMEVEESVTTSSQTRMESRNVEDQTVYSRFSGAIARTPSPQQIFDGASKKVVAGFAAAGAAVGGVLTSIREEEKDEFVDHSRWSEEYAHRAGADPSTIPGAAIGTAAVVKELGAEVGSQVVGGATAPLPPRQEIRPQAPIKRRDPNKKRKSVAIVVSAETSGAIDAEPMSAGSFGEHIVSLPLTPLTTSRTHLY